MYGIGFQWLQCFNYTRLFTVLLPLFCAICIAGFLDTVWEYVSLIVYCVVYIIFLLIWCTLSRENTDSLKYMLWLAACICSVLYVPYLVKSSTPKGVPSLEAGRWKWLFWYWFVFTNKGNTTSINRADLFLKISILISLQHLHCLSKSWHCDVLF